MHVCWLAVRMRLQPASWNYLVPSAVHPLWSPCRAASPPGGGSGGLRDGGCRFYNTTWTCSSRFELIYLHRFLTIYMLLFPTPSRPSHWPLLPCQVITAAGFELARVTLVDGEGRSLLDQLVLPQRPVLDHNTKYSGGLR